MKKLVKSVIKRLKILGAPLFLGCSYPVWKDPVSFFQNDCQQVGLEAALKDLKRRFKRLKPASVKCLLELYKFLHSCTSLTTQELETKKKLIIHIPCWSSRYVEKCVHCLLPSLMARNNIPWLSQHVAVEVLFHCDKTTRDTIISSAVYLQTIQYAHIRWIVIPSKIFGYYKKAESLKGRTSLKYLFLGALQAQALQIGRQVGAYISFQMPDLLISDSFYRVIFEQGQHKAVVVTTAFCSNYPTVKEAVTPYYQDKEEAILSVSSAVLNAIQLQHMHPRSKVRIVSESTKNFIATPQLIFKSSHHVVIRALHYHPFLMNCSKINKSIPQFYLPIDNEALAFVIDDQKAMDEQVWIADTLAAAICELSDEYVNPPRSLQDRTYSTKEIIKRLLPFFNYRPITDLPPLQAFLFAHRFKVAAVAQDHFEEEGAFVQQLNDALSNVSQNNNDM